MVVKTSTVELGPPLLADAASYSSDNLYMLFNQSCDTRRNIYAARDAQ